MRPRARRLLALLFVSYAVSACTPQATRNDALPTIGEAHGFLAQVVTLAEHRDFAGLCALGDGNCERSLDLAGRDAVPRSAPTVVGFRILPSATTGDQTSIGGVILEMCGRDGAGQPYHSEMLVFRDESGLRAINPVYWNNTRIAGGNETLASLEPRPC